MTLVLDTRGLRQRAEENDLQSISGVLLDGFDPAVDHPLNWGLDRIVPSDVMAIATGLRDRYLSNAVAFLRALQVATGMIPLPGFDPMPAAPAIPPRLVNNPINAWDTLAAHFRLIPDFQVTDRAFDGISAITDLRRSRLYVTVDLNEWVEFRNRDVVHLVLNNWNGFSPLGISTVWLRADAWIQHNRGKSARVYLQGRIAERLQQQLVQGETISPLDFVNKILDADAETAFSSVYGPC